jgi:hypothetical protein
MLNTQGLRSHARTRCGRRNVTDNGLKQAAHATCRRSLLQGCRKPSKKREISVEKTDRTTDYGAVRYEQLPLCLPRHENEHVLVEKVFVR